jgi:rubrerythrin
MLAELYIKAKKYAKAKTECQIFLLKNPATQKIAELLQEMERKAAKNGKPADGLFASIRRRLAEMGKEATVESCPKDFQWVCANCGHTESIWQPICPECGEIGRNYWHLYVDKKTAEVEEI